MRQDKRQTLSRICDWLSQCGWTDNEILNLDIRHIDATLSFEEWKSTFVGAFCSFKRMPHILRYVADAMGKDIPVWKDFTLPTVKMVVKTIAEKVSANSARTYMAHVVSVLNSYKDVEPGIPRVDYTKAMAAVKRTPTQHVVLTEEEIDRLIDIWTESDTEMDVKRAFIIEALCGARSSDAKGITEDNVQDGWITYVSKKTKTLTSVPLHRKLLPFLRIKPVKDHNRGVVNDIIQRLCRRAGIDTYVEIYKGGRREKAPKWQLVGSHTARRSFATNLALRNIPVATISKFMGHSSVAMTSKYICIDKSAVSDDVMAFFG